MGIASVLMPRVEILGQLSKREERALREGRMNAASAGASGSAGEYGSRSDCEEVMLNNGLVAFPSFLIIVPILFF